MTNMRTRRQIEGLLSYLLDVQYIYEEYKMPPQEKKLLPDSFSTAYTLVNRDFLHGNYPPPTFQPDLEQAGLIFCC